MFLDCTGSWCDMQIKCHFSSYNEAIIQCHTVNHIFNAVLSTVLYLFRLLLILGFGILKVHFHKTAPSIYHRYIKETLWNLKGTRWPVQSNCLVKCRPNVLVGRVGEIPGSCIVGRFIVPSCGNGCFTRQIGECNHTLWGLDLPLSQLAQAANMASISKGLYSDNSQVA